MREVVPGVTGERGAGGACVPEDGAPQRQSPGLRSVRQGCLWSCLLVGRGAGPCAQLSSPGRRGLPLGVSQTRPRSRAGSPRQAGSGTGLSNPLMESGSSRSSPHPPAKDSVHAPRENRCPDTGASQDHLPRCASRVSRHSEDFAAGFPCVDAIFQGKLITLPSTGLPPTQGRVKAMGLQDQGPLRSDGGLHTETQNMAFLL